MYDEKSIAGLQEISGKKPILKNRVDPAIEEAVMKMAINLPGYGRLRVSNELKRQDLFISPGGVRSIWLRNQTETFQKWLKALETKMVTGNMILTLAQVLEKAKEEKVVIGERNRTPWLSWSAGYLLRGHYKRGWAHLPTNFHRHLY